jgi:hypothetical protein
VLQIKPDGTLKARFVTHGFSQLKGIDYDKTYMPVLHLKNLQLALAYREGAVQPQAGPTHVESNTTPIPD